MAISNSVKSAIENSAKFARAVGSNKIESEHLLYGILTIQNNRGTNL